MEDIRNLFINAHHLLNLYRPHQARESLIAMMEEQLQDAKDEIQEMDKVKERAEAFLRELEAEGREAVAGRSTTEAVAETANNGEDQSDEQETSEGEARKMWGLLNAFEEG